MMITNSSNPVNILPGDGEVYLFETYFSKAESDRYYQQLLTETSWRQEPVRVFGKMIMQPRLTAWYGDTGKPYTYSGITMQPCRWTGSLLEIKSRIEQAAGVRFSNALLNLYRNGRDSMGWHRDNERELGVNPVIGSLSFGAKRTFQLRHFRNKSLVKTIELTHGSFLLMKGETQHLWEHRIPKRLKVSDTRINLTFRVIKSG